MRGRRWCAWALAALLTSTLAPGELAADLVLERTVVEVRTTALGEKLRTRRRERVYVAPQRVLILDLVFSQDLLIQLDRGLLIRMDRQARTARVLRLDDLGAARRRLLADLRVMQERAPGTLPARALEPAIAALAGAEETSTVVLPKEGGDSGEVCGHAVRAVTIEHDGARTATVWVAQHDQGGALLAAWERMGLLPAGAAAQMVPIGNVPLRLEGQTLECTDRIERSELVVQLGEETVPAARYEIPDGFQVREVPWFDEPSLAQDPAGGREDGDEKPEAPAVDAPADGTGTASEGAPEQPDRTAPERPDAPSPPDRGRR